MNKKLAASVIAASLLLGGGIIGAQQYKAYADSTAFPTAMHDNFHNMHPDFPKNQLIQDAASILGLEQSAILGELKLGKTLAQIAQEAGLSEADFLKKLTDARQAEIDRQVTDGKIKPEQADKIKSALADRLKARVEQPFGLHEKRGFKGRHHGGGGFFGGPQAMAQILGMTPETLKSELESGKSLAEIAQEKGMTEEVLIDKIKDSMTDKLKTFVERKRTGTPKNPAHTGENGPSMQP